MRQAANDNNPLPAGLIPRGLCRTAAAAYIGIGPTLFDSMVADGRMPIARAAGGRVIWDRRELDEAFDVLPRHGRIAVTAGNPWDEAA